MENIGAGWHFSETVVHITEKKQRSNNVMDEERVLLDDVLTSDGDVAYIEEQCHDCGAAVCVRVTKETDGYREFPRKPRPLAARMNWKNKFKIT
jgi:Fe-S oxidoreductase